MEIRKVAPIFDISKAIKMNNLKITITCLDINNRVNGMGYKILPAIYSFEGVDVNSIKAIMIGPFGSCYERDSFYNNLPKYYKATTPTGYGKKEDGSDREYYVCFQFDAFHSDCRVGEKNESAIGRRDKIIAKLKKLGFK